MECRMKSRVKSMVEEWTREHQRELAAAGTLVELEILTCQIGDEFARQLCESELVGHARQATDAEKCECPDCGTLCPRGQPEPVVLQGLRGEVCYNQPSYFCRRCRRSFFPAGRSFGTVGAEHGRTDDFAEDGLGGQQSQRLCGGRRGNA